MRAASVLFQRHKISHRNNQAGTAAHNRTCEPCMNSSAKRLLKPFFKRNGFHAEFSYHWRDILCPVLGDAEDCRLCKLCFFEFHRCRRKQQEPDWQMNFALLDPKLR